MDESLALANAIYIGGEVRRPIAQATAKIINSFSYFFMVFLSANVSVHPRRTLCAVRVQRLVRCDFHWLFSFIKVVMMPNRAIASSRMPIKVAPRYGLRFSSVPGNEISISCRIKPDAGVPCRSDLPISLKMMKPANPANTAIIPLAMM